MTEEEQRAFERFDKPEWVACGNLRLRVLLSVCHETITRLGGKIENLQDSLAAADRRIAELEKGEPQGEVVVTWTEDGGIVMVTRQDEEGRILSVIAQAGKPPRTDVENLNAWIASKFAAD